MKFKLLLPTLFSFLFAFNQVMGITIILTPTDASCNNSNGNITSFVFGGVAPYTYLWNIGSTSANLSGLPPGNYTMYVTDAIGDTTSASATINNQSVLQNVSISFTIPGSGIQSTHPCNNQCNGIAYAETNQASGTPPYYMASTMGHTQGTYGATNIPTLSGICWTDYFMVNIWDATGCGTLFQNPLWQSVAPSFNHTQQVNPACNGLANGSMSFVFTALMGQNLTGTYAGPANGNFVSNGNILNISNLLPGQYTMIVTDPYTANCDTTFQVMVNDLGAGCGTISGKVYLDTNSNCLLDGGELSLPSRIIKFSPGNYFATSNANGDYSALLPYANYNVSTVPVTHFTNTCPVNNVNLTSGNNNITGIDVGDSTNNQLDLSIALSGWAARPGFSYQLNITVTNNSIVACTAPTVVLDYSSILTLLGSSLLYNVSGANQITLQLPSIPGFGYTSGTVTFLVPPNPALIGTILTSTATVNANQSEPDLSNNSTVHNRTITGSYDPNEKLVWPSRDMQNIFMLNVDTMFTYSIGFQNTGNDTAFTVILIDTLNPHLKIESFEFTGSSHPCFWEITGQNILKVHYNNIHLPDSTTDEPGSHGLFSFNIKPKPSLQTVPLPYLLTNRAAIYFDFNPPIFTNTVFSTVDFPTGISSSGAPEFRVIPNPADNVVQIRISDPEESVTISLMDLSGRKLISKKNTKGVVDIDISELSGGMYLVLVQSKNFSRMEKLIKR